MTRARDLGLACGRGKPGKLNSIADVPGVTVGHATLSDGAIQTGVTAIRPHGGNLFREKLVASSVVLNGFGKSIGLVQVAELGTLETPILLTNTLSVGSCATALIRRAIAENPDIGRETSTVNPVVMECNDGFLNDIQALKISEADARAALDTAREDFAVGAVGAGRGMSCFGFKGGIGSASRKLKLDGEKFHLGVLSLCNFGRAGDLTLPDGSKVAPPADQDDKGSVIIVMATDIPLEERQIRRVIARAGVGLARVGSFWGHGSGDIALGFSTANRVSHDEKSDLIPRRVLNESRIDRLFEAMAETTHESVLDALAAAEAVTGRDGNFRPRLADTLGEKA
ncbi:P1 family peptidase [Lacibacterium aquatile]|uniref:P1 family peptidase n=1 Tax=Lacibacterium aquatile TaxID=1168082 RepID=A0ABW5DNS2_9PROT